ncbi:MAG: NYN domain-containing protein [Mycobacteriales bacterium]
MGRPEKGVDAAIVTDLLSLAWQDAFDVAVLVSSDADFVPAVERVQEKGLKVINAAWQGKGHELKAACWASFDLDTIASTIRR